MAEKEESKMGKPEYKRSYIAFIDILGFKNIVNKRPCEEIIEIYNTIDEWAYLSEELETDSGRISKPVIDPDDIHISVMSDSICIYVEASIPESLFCLLFMCAHFQSRMLGMEIPVLLRGAITVGDIIQNKSVIYGPGFVEAYLMEGNNAKFPRIILNRCVWDAYVKEHRRGESEPFFCRLDFDGFYSINYCEMFEWFNKKDKDRRTLEDISEYVDGVLYSTIDNSIRDKYLYLNSELTRCIDLKQPQV